MKELTSYNRMAGYLNKVFDPVSYTHLKLENNLMTASLQTLVNIANVLGIDIDYLLCESYPTNRENNIDVFLNGLIDELSQQDKEFIIHVINGLKLYRAQDS